MSFLDLYQGDQQQAMRPQANEGHDLPATFGESFRAAWDYGRQFEQSTSGENARMDALDDYLKELQTSHGVDLAPKLDWVEPSSGAPLGSASMLAQLNGAVGKLNQGRSSDQALPTLDEDGLQQRAVDKSRAAGKALADISGREHSGLGLLAGGLASTAVDPMNLLAIPLAPETGGMSLLGQALTFGGVAAASQAAIEAVGGGYREQVQPGYLQSGAPVLNVAEAFAGGAVLGGVTRALGNAWTKVKTGSWPTSVRDAGNVIESHANVADTNVYAGAEGEAAHWDAMNFAIDDVLHERPVDVTDIITPQIEEKARNLMVRLEGEHPGLPAFDHRSIALLSEEAGLRSRMGELEEPPAIAEANTTAADRLNRLQTVEEQLQTAEGDARKKLLGRRDQILVDTTPEQLRADAAPIAKRQQIEAERARITDRLGEIEQERSTARGNTFVGLGQPAIGQREIARPMSIEDLRRMAGATSDIAAQERVTAPPEELPFQATAAEAHARASADALADGVKEIASRAGYTMPQEEAARLADALTRMSPEDAQDALRSLQVSPRQADAIVEHPSGPKPAERPAVPDAQAIKSTLDSADHEKALQADIDRERVADVSRQIPVDVDKDGNVVYRSLDSMADEAEAYRKVSEQIAGCAAPAAPEGPA